MFLTPTCASTSTRDAAYPGSPLEPHEIRTIRLCPGAWNDPIVCHLTNINIDVAKYQALSYVWGSEKVTRLIRLNNRAHSVTVNLEGALRHLRAKFKDGIILWVDALYVIQKKWPRSLAIRLCS